MRSRMFVLLFLGCLYSVGLNGQTLSLLDRPEERGVHEYEKEMFLEAAGYLDSLEMNNQLLRDSNLLNYFYRVTDRLLPGQRAITPWKIYVQKDLVPNAAAFPDGSLLISTGLLLRFDSEAQLAFVLAHELSHYLYRHALLQHLALKPTNPSYKRQHDLKSADFSREMEWEADAIALELYANAGYPKNEAAEALRRLPAEMNYAWIFSVFYANRPHDSRFRSHPRTPDRVENLVTLSKEKKFRDTPESSDGYKAATKKVNLATRKNLIEAMGDFSNATKARQIHFLFTQMDEQEKKTPFAWEMKLAQSEAWLNLVSLPKGAAFQEMSRDYKQANYKGQSKEQEEKVFAISFSFDKEQYEKRIGEVIDRLFANIASLRTNPNLAPEADRLEGVLQYQQENYAAALPLLKAYLHNEDGDTQRRYIRRLIREIEEEASNLNKKKRRNRRN